MADDNDTQEAPATDAAEYELSKEALAKIEDLKTRYPEDQPRAPLLMVLHVVQEEFGFVPDPMLAKVAELLDIPKIWVEEVVSFYPLFRWEHRGRRQFGKNHLGICVTLSCQLGGCREIVDHVKSKYGVDWDGVSEDGNVSLQEFQCLGSCHTAPVVLWNDIRHEGITVEELDKMIEGGRADG